MSHSVFVISSFNEESHPDFSTEGVFSSWLSFTVLTFSSGIESGKAWLFSTATALADGRLAIGDSRCWLIEYDSPANCASSRIDSLYSMKPEKGAARSVGTTVPRVGACHIVSSPHAHMTRRRDRGACPALSSTTTSSAVRPCAANSYTIV